MIVAWIGAAMLVLIGVLVAAYLVPPLVVRWLQVRTIRRVAHGRVALTFDDGPDDELTSLVLDLLASHNVKATFFLVGSRAQSSPEVCDRILAEGHEVATHSQNHLNAWRLSPGSGVRDAVDAYASLSRWCGPRALFRPPFGKTTTPVLWSLRRRGSHPVWWTHSAMDAIEASPRAEVVADRVLSDGGVVLLHSRHRIAARREYLLRLTTMLLNDAPARDVRFCTASEMLDR